MVRADMNEKMQPDIVGNVYQQMNGDSDLLVIFFNAFLRRTGHRNDGHVQQVPSS